MQNVEPYNSNSNSTLHDIKKALVNSTFMFVSQLYSSYTINRVHVQEIIDVVSELLVSEYLSILKKGVFTSLSKFNCTNEALSELSSISNACENIFDGLHTEYERLQAFKESTCYIAPVTYVIGSNCRPTKELN